MRTSFCVVLAVISCVCQPASALPAGPASGPIGRVSLSLDEAQTLAVQVEPAAVHETDATLTAPGFVTYADLRVAHVVSPVSGRVVSVLAQPGEMLAQGAVLATIASPDLATSVSDLARAQAALDVAVRDLRRQEKLFAKRAVPQQGVVAAWDAYRRAQSEMGRARATWRLLRGLDGSAHPKAASFADTDKGIYALRAPIAGVVVGRAIAPGADVAGQYGGGAAKEIYTVADLQEVWLYAEVHEADLARVRMGALVQVRADAVPGRIWRGAVGHISDVLDPVSRVAPVRVVMGNADGALKPDMFVAVAIEAPGRRALTVPRCSLLHMGDAAFVFVELDAGPGPKRTFERRHVRLDEALGEVLVPVAAGLAPGERVVTHGIDGLLAKLEARL